LITEALPAGLVAPPILLSLLAVTGLMASDYHNMLAGRFIFKPLAAMAFIWLALVAGAFDSTYGQVLLAGLVLAAAGDVFLMFESQGAFMAGLVSFLCGHLLYAVAFVQLPVDFTGMFISLLPAVILVLATLLWLRGHLPGAMRYAVPAYMLVIAAMLVFAGGTWGQPGALLIIAGAWGFAFSDVFVARRQFISVDPRNKLWGTPLYFGSQMLLALSVAQIAL
jgi:uncharacterized membrane protein YhhN